ncbi:TonB-dependent receptor plug domain-containing protein [Sphingobium algorifonticola]|uniref:TonB-dependent receptor n=1 Tax=Sphingobium algorifonticola TaxID=2008318 RepID=A0A437JCW9_9SPHN|nr:TonB-dependent receptor [Sphingobium algorifonticola]RVT43603.1 TonB-dependent receptor [Sphingobium algorifonticola]
MGDLQHSAADGCTKGHKRARLHLLATIGSAAFCLAAHAAHAQDVTPAADLDQAEPQSTDNMDITVTGSRIVRDGYDAPTPVSVVSTKELKAEAPANISDFVNTLPAVRGSGTAASTNGSLSNGAAGVNSVNLRSLGAARTLVLFDGQRSVASTTTGQVDVNTFPQALISRVEVVTGGASSAYGSDAVSGVVNFILDKEYKGFKAEYEHGVTTYGDGPNHKFTATGGKEFAGGKGHILLSGEYFTQKGIQTIDRDWNDSGYFLANNPAYSSARCTDAASLNTPCVAEFIVSDGIGTGQFTPGGLVSTGPLRGTYFGSVNPATGKATVNQLNFGATSGQWMIGGDTDITTEGHRGSATLLPSETRASAFGRVSYEFSPAFELFGQLAYSYYNGKSFYQQTPTTGVVIQRDNAYLPDSVRAAMVANNLTSIQIGTSNIDIPPQGSDNKREVGRYVLGAEGDFGMFGKDWSWDAYYQYGRTKTRELLTNAWNIQRMTLATDAVVAPAGNAAGIAAGTIVCRSTLTNPSNGCVPLNRIGVGGASQAAINYVLYNGSQPLRTQDLRQEVAAFNLSTNNLFDMWAGPVSLAFGGEYRKESVSGYVDPLYQPIVTNGVTTGTWIYGNYLPTFGKYNVKEAYVETIVPLFKGMDFNGAFRITDYSTSGTVKTWKAGLTWQAIDDIKFRGTISRDIRAPNLSELFAPGTGRTNTVNVPQPNGTVAANQFNESTVGNSDLRPEIAKTYGAGVILTPTFLPGFAVSVDYYDITLKGAISSLTAQTLVDRCYLQNIAESCAFISTTGGRGVTTPGLAVTSIEIKPTNFVSQKTRGIDFEASYRRPMFGGNVTLRALASRAFELTTENGVTLATDAAGENTGSLPDWTYRLTAGYDNDAIAFQFVGRGVSGGVYNNNYIVCSTDCPLSTADNRTINRNKIPGAFYLDFNASYSFEVSSAKMQAFVSIRNVLNTDPVLVGNGPTGNNTPAYPQTNRNLYDVLGRVFRMGVRLAL